MRSVTEWSGMLLLAALFAACGGGSGSGSMGTDAGTVEDGGDAAVTDAGAGECRTVEDCPARACEVATACEAGRCIYGPFVCGASGQLCPVQSCVSEEREGHIVNRCELVENAPCGEGGRCVDDRCVPPVRGFRLRGRLESAGIAATRGRIELVGEMGGRPATLTPRTAGRMRLGGTLKP